MILSGDICGGACWDELTQKRLENPLSLERYGYKVYSQNDEDGIISEIFRRIGTTNKEFIEFGVQDGLESNCHLLMHKGWKGLWIEGSKDCCNEISIKFKPAIKAGVLRICNAFITKDNIDNLIKEYAFSSAEPDFLSIDVDGNDYYIWESIRSISPRVVCIEYNGKFPPDLEWVQAYNAAHVWDYSDWCNASLKSREILGSKKGYQLVCTNIRGVNAFFVRKDLINDKFVSADTSEELYNPLRFDLVFNTPGHVSKYGLMFQEDNLGIQNYYESEKVYKKIMKKKKIERMKFVLFLKKIIRNL